MTLYELAKKEAVIFRFNTKVVDVQPGSGIVTLADGEQLSADLVVAADGYYSFIRKYIVENEDEEAETAIGTKKLVLVSVSLPLEKLSTDETLQPLSNPSLVTFSHFLSAGFPVHQVLQWTFWLGDGFIGRGSAAVGKTFFISIHHSRLDTGRIHRNMSEFIH